MDAVRNETEPEMLPQREGPLNDIIMAVLHHRAAVAQMGHHGQAGINGGTEVVQGRIGVTGGNHHAFFFQETGDAVIRVMFRSQGEDTDETRARLEQPGGQVFVGVTNGVGRMRPAKAVLGTEEGTLNMKARDHLANQRIGFAQCHQAVQPADHCIRGFRYDGGENARHAIGPQVLAGPVKILRAQIILIVINAAIAVDLNVEVSHGGPGYFFPRSEAEAGSRKRCVSGCC